ncbi:sensor domain-containing diguanylate cyclase [Crassaminicella profunda]|uniref:sensor domain-containing diguanylate cyclase n=1 Tax=Crassaminicella profunda TaxID=1286698 RepID=UPI001CA63C33|nr:diguanylate cyclase [Crassaminicella profunda]QZY54054.1 diguanylate cyclase [Crassaminicella profunda]
MDFTKIMRTKKIFIKYLLVLFLGISLLYSALFTLIHFNTINIEKNKMELNEKRIITLEKNILGKEFMNIISDVLYLADSIEEHTGIEESVNYNYLAKEWLRFSDRKKIYDQIRFIDISGNEQIRVNYYNKSAHLVSASDLQNKKQRYYFQDTIKLEREQIYISKMDLNIENGKIEEPLKPMIRFSTPVFSKSGEQKGIVILNYYAKYLLEDFKNIYKTSDGEVFLLDSNGYWISNKDPSKEWAFMYPDKKDINFKNEFPNEWNILQQNNEGMKYTDNGLFVFSNVVNRNNLPIQEDHSKIVLGEGNWKVVSFISKESKNGNLVETNNFKILWTLFLKYKSYFLLIFILSIFISFLMSQNKINKEEIKYFSEYDAMTNVLNRRAGMAFLSDRIHQAIKDTSKVSVCFIDINGLKEVNDILGHEAGDELILTAVNVIKSCIRELDFVIRLGGDEFLIVFHNAPAEQAEKVWERINNEYQRINKNENRKYLISISHGIAEVEGNDIQYIDKIINLADERMYIEKRELKKNIKIIR